MSWLVGLDLRNPHAGVVQFAKWLRRQGSTGALQGLHVVETGEAPASPELLQQAERSVVQYVERAGAIDVFSGLGTVDGSTVEDALIASCSEHQADGVIVGRRVGVGEQRLVRLGSVTRRVLRRLPASVIVVPPDFEPDGVGGGPVLVAVTQAWDVAWAAHQLATSLAAGIGREVAVVYVAPPSRSWDTPYLAPDQQAQQRQQQKIRVERELGDWMAQRGISAERKIVVQGRPLETILEVAAELEAALIVCGRPKGTAIQRFLGGTTATDLAAYSSVPVAVASTS